MKTLTHRGIVETEDIPFFEMYKHYSQMSTIPGTGYAPLPVSEWLKLTKQGRVIKLKKKEVLVRAQDKVEEGYVVLKGLLKMFYTDIKGKEFIKAFRVPFDSASPYGELIQEVPSRITISAIEESEVFAFPYKAFVHLSINHPSWEKIALNQLKEHFLFKERREFELLTYDATERFESFAKDYPDLVSRVPQKEIASYLGINPVTLSRIITNKSQNR